jgi:hypothetical protein
VCAYVCGKRYENEEGKRREAEVLRTKVLRYREFVRGSIEVFHPRGDKAPLHERSPEKDCLGSCTRQKRLPIVRWLCSTGSSLERDAPAGWFMNDWNRDADAPATAPDIFEVRMSTVNVWDVKMERELLPTPACLTVQMCKYNVNRPVPCYPWELSSFLGCCKGGCLILRTPSHIVK